MTGRGEKPRLRGREGARAVAERQITAWTAEVEDRFLEALAASSNVRESARAAGVSDTTVYRHRRSSAEFRAKWAVALREGFVKLETLMLERALSGVDRPVWHRGEQVGTVHEYDDRLCLALLRAHRDAVHCEPPVVANLSDEEMRAAVADRLRAMNRNMGGAG